MCQLRLSPAFDVYSNYREKIPGRFVLFVDADLFAREVTKSTGHMCSAHFLSFEPRQCFIQAVGAQDHRADCAKKSNWLIEPSADRGARIEILSGPDPAIKSDEYIARITFLFRIFGVSTASSTVDISASLIVDGSEGRYLGTSASANHNQVTNCESASCGDGAQAIADANSRATKELLSRLAERLANEPRLKEPLAKVALTTTYKINLLRSAFFASGATRSFTYPRHLEARA